MDCSSIYIFENEADRKNLYMYQSLVNIIRKTDCGISPQYLAAAKRPEKCYHTYDDIHTFGMASKRAYEEDCQKIENYLQELKRIHGDSFDISIYHALKGTDKQAMELTETWNHFFSKLVYSLKITYADSIGLSRAFLTYCSSFRDCCFETQKGDMFILVTGDSQGMEEEVLLEASETIEEIELASKVKIGYSSQIEPGGWFQVLE